VLTAPREPSPRSAAYERELQHGQRDEEGYEDDRGCHGDSLELDLTFGQTIDAGARYDYKTEFVAVTAVGDWAFVAQSNSCLGADDEFLVPLSTGTRLVSLYRLDIKGSEEFRFVEEGEVRFSFWAQEGYSEEVPDELVETMKQIDHDYGKQAYELYQGPGLVLIERLTRIKLTGQILEGSSCLSGVIPKSPTTT
jgi:hypothetical protein